MEECIMMTFLSLLLMYLVFGVLAWQFWFLTVATYFTNEVDQKKFEKLMDFSLFWFIVLWPLSLLYSIWIIFTIDKEK